MPIWAYQGAGWGIFASLDPYQSLAVAVCNWSDWCSPDTEAELQSVKSFHVK